MVTAFLDGATATLAGETLILTKGDVTLTLLDKEVADTRRDDRGPAWVVTDVQTGSTVSRSRPGRPRP